MINRRSNKHGRGRFWIGATACCLAFIVYGCLDVIDIEVSGEAREKLVIQGHLIVGDPSLVQVKVSKLFDFTATSKRPTTARQVSLIDENGRSIVLKSLGQGDYAISIPRDYPDFSVELGRFYRLRLETFDGRIFESDPEKGLAVPRMDDLSFQLVQGQWPDATGGFRPQELIRYTIDTPLRTSEQDDDLHLRWQTEWTFKVQDSPYQHWIEQKTCYVTQQLDVTALDIFAPRAYETDYLFDHVVYENAITRNYGEGLVFTVIQQSMDENAYNYFDQVAQNTFREGSMFERPPGTLVSNIHNITDAEDAPFGYFFVTQQDTLHTYVRPEAVGSPPHYCPPPGGILTMSGYCADFICCDCLSVDNSTVTKPDFWEE